MRRLKSDIRALEGGFPRRTVAKVAIDGLPVDAAELVLPRMLDAYRLEREKRLKSETRSRQAAGALVIGGLQKRLLSSIEAFARTLKVHRKSVERAMEGATEALEISGEQQADLERLTVGEEAGSDDVTEYDRETDAEADGTPSEDQADPSELDLADLMSVATKASSDSQYARARTALQHELALVDDMSRVAEASRYDADPRVRKIVEWIDANMCPLSSRSQVAAPQWNDRRLLIFTEYEDTRRWLQRCLEEAVAHSDRASDRIAAFTGMTSRQRRGRHQARLQRGTGRPSAAHSHRDGRRSGRPQSPAALSRTLPFRPPLEPEPPRSAKRPHRSQAATRRRGVLSLTSSSSSGRKIASSRFW